MHPQRTALHNELHARPSLYFNEPAHVFHIALLDQSGVSEAVIAALAERAPAPWPPGTAQGLVDLLGHAFGELRRSALQRLAHAALMLRRLFAHLLPLLRQSAGHALHGLAPASKALLVGRQLGRL